MRPGGGRWRAALLRVWLLELARVLAIGALALLVVVLLAALGIWGGVGRP